MARPVLDPRWNDLAEGDTDYNVEPAGALKNTGWAVGEKPGSQHMNWLFNLIYRWIVWLTSRVDLHTTARLTFIDGKGATQNGSDWTLSGNAASATVATPGDLQYDLRFKEGEVVSEVVLRVQTQVATLGAMRARLIRVNDDGSQTTMATTTSAASGALQDLGLSLTFATVPTTIPATPASYYVVVDSNSGTGGAMGRAVYSLRILSSDYAE